MEQVQWSALIIYTVNIVAHCFPINHGFTVKFNPVSISEAVHPKSFGALFAKYSRNLTTAQVRPKQAVLSNQFSQAPELVTGCTNYLTRISFPHKLSKKETPSLEKPSMLNVPIIGQPFEKYKMLVASAPPHFNLNAQDDEEPMVIYIVFPDDNVTASSGSVNIPTIYFANQRDEKFGLNKQAVDPILIINNNRTVTNLKSKEIRKFLKFKNKSIPRNTSPTVCPRGLKKC